ncbi:MAG: Hsp20/alpha crystallin family protein [Gemmataceae bacterium]|nr:Hsp20/alpha crystallin family protein [Gemmataceae bacterium]
MSNTQVQKADTGELTAAEADRGFIQTPRVDIIETEQELMVFADLPGVKQDAVDIRFERGELTLHARRTVETPSGGFAHSEFSGGDYFRSFRVSDRIDASKITAELKHGVLALKLPKVEAAKPQRIAVTCA